MGVPAGWNRIVEYTIPSAKCPVSYTDMPVKVIESNLPSEMFDADGSYPAQNGGADIRCYADVDCTIPLARHVRFFITDNNPANGSCEIIIKRTVSVTTGGKIWFVYNNSGASEPAPDSTYGSENAYTSDHSLVMSHQDYETGAPEILDATSNDNDGTTTSMSSSNSVPGHCGNALEFIPTADYYEIADDNTLDLDGDFSIIIVFKSNVATGWKNVFEKGTYGWNQMNYGLWLGANGKMAFTTYWAAVNDLYSLNTISADTWYMATLVFDDVGNYKYIYIDNDAGNSAIMSLPPATNSANLWVGYGRGTASYRWSGFMDEYRVLKGKALSSNERLLFFNNIMDTANFGSSGTPQSPADGVITPLSII